MAFTLLDLLQGTTPTFDAQAIPEFTDWQILANANQGYGVPIGGSAPVVSLCVQTYTTSASPVALSTLTGAAVLTLTGVPAFFSQLGGYFSCPTTGGGTATLSYTGVSGSTLTGVLYISGGSGNIAASTTITAQFAYQTAVSQAIVAVNYVAVPLLATNGGSGVFGTVISLTAPGGGFATLPASTAGDRKDLLVVNATGTPSIVQGTACSTVDWTRISGASYATPAPAKAAWSSSFPVVLGEIYVPGLGSTHGNTSIGAGNYTDKSVVTSLNQISAGASKSTDVTIVSANTPVTVFTSPSLPVGEYQICATVQYANTGATPAQVSAAVIAGTATATSLPSGEQFLPGVNGEGAQVVLVGTVTVTVAGTLILQAQANIGSSAVVVKAHTPTAALTGATNWTVTRVGP